MIEPSPMLLIAAASAFIGLVAEHPENGQPDDGTALLHRWGYWSHFDHRAQCSSWPLIETRTADELAKVATTKYILRDAPVAGDIFLQCSPVTRRFAITIEASTEEDGRLGGRRTLRVARRFLPSRGDRFIRWAELDDNVDVDGRAVIGRILARVIPGGEGARLKEAA